METTNNGQQDAGPTTTCFKHSRRATSVRCTRCDRFICPDCMREAPVGFRCPECIRSESKTVRAATTVFGGQLSSRPYVTYTLIAITIIVYLVELADPGVVGRFSNLGIGLVGPDGGHFLDDGVNRLGFTQEGVAYGQWERLLTSAFLHLSPSSGVFSIAHILLNMYWLWLLGRILEEQLGWWRFLAVYLVCALGGSVLGFLVDPAQSAVGASGAIFGLASCYFVIASRMSQQPIDRHRLITMLVIWMVISAGFTSWQGHLGGLLTGGLLGAALAYAPRQHRLAVHVSVFTATTFALLVTTGLQAANLTT
ncbi:rhomboid family intramembrane serine protease [Rhizocola hellebori]|uniref:Rhomboid family intramembrane serine protease n=1 Tax=Rhizocola hellebori TaxID=1392758 RepID=A0A8J3VEV3_9ACTN|nr:rhomboid family intramembrane serine protease [Rhizocola hellebori]GIH03910.1 rhomboid family intramembrane serine protease [Rhizocola hellebori]